MCNGGVALPGPIDMPAIVHSLQALLPLDAVLTNGAGNSAIVLLGNSSSFCTIRTHQEGAYRARVIGSALTNPEISALARWGLAFTKPGTASQTKWQSDTLCHISNALH